MAVKPKDALNYVGADLENKISELEMAIDSHLNENYNGESIEIVIKDLDELIVVKEITTKAFYTQKVLIELRKRYADWNIEDDFKANKGMILKFSEKNVLEQLNESAKSNGDLTSKPINEGFLATKY